MQKEQSTQFQFTPQLAFVLAMVGMALAIPMVCVVLAYKAYSTPKRPDLPPEALAPLQKALEDVAAKELTQPVTISTESPGIEISAASWDAGLEAVRESASALGGVVLPKSSESKVLVQLPSERIEIFTRSLKGMHLEKMSEMPTGGDTTLIEVHITVVPPKP